MRLIAQAAARFAPACAVLLKPSCMIAIIDITS